MDIQNNAIVIDADTEALDSQITQISNDFAETYYLDNEQQEELEMLVAKAMKLGELYERQKWQAKAQAVPEGFVLVPKEPNLEFKDRLRSYLDNLWMGEWGCDWDGFICVNGIDPNHVWKIVTDTKVMIEAQEPAND